MTDNNVYRALGAERQQLPQLPDRTAASLRRRSLLQLAPHEGSSLPLATTGWVIPALPTNLPTVFVDNWQHRLNPDG